MRKLLCVWVGILLGCSCSAGGSLFHDTIAPSLPPPVVQPAQQYFASADFLDAAINSLQALQSLLKKENYRNKVTSFHNPTSTELGFSLENEINLALKPLLAKAKTVNPVKFSEVISSLIQAPYRLSATQPAIGGLNPIFAAIAGLVGNISLQEKKITRSDLDSFIAATGKYFLQYQRLNQANQVFDLNLERLNGRMVELQFDIREFILDLILILYKEEDRAQLRTQNLEELFLRFLEKAKLENVIAGRAALKFPSDGLKSAKDIAYSLQKLFNEYQKIYGENYQQIRTVLLDSKNLGRNTNIRQIDQSLKELEQLYLDSRQSDLLGIRLKTLFERLRLLAGSEQKES